MMGGANWTALRHIAESFAQTANHSQSSKKLLIRAAVIPQWLWCEKRMGGCDIRLGVASHCQRPSSNVTLFPLFQANRQQLNLQRLTAIYGLFDGRTLPRRYRLIFGPQHSD
jgi:hypothetical protein